MSTSNTKDLNQVAQEAAQWFETRNREEQNELGTYAYVALRAGHPDWLRDVVFSAHDNGAVLPDDYRYQITREAVDFIADNPSCDEDSAHEFADDVDIYTSDLVAWLGSHSSRPLYCDDAIEEGLIDCKEGIVRLIGAGQYQERYEVFAAVLQGLQEVADAS